MKKPTMPRHPTTSGEPEKHYRSRYTCTLKKIFEQEKEYSIEDFFAKLRKEVDDFSSSYGNEFETLSEEPDIKMGIEAVGDWECRCDEMEEEEIDESDECYYCENGRYDFVLHYNVINENYSKAKHDAWAKSHKEYFEVKMPKYEKSVVDYIGQLEKYNQYQKDEKFKKIEKAYQEALAERSKN